MTSKRLFVKFSLFFHLLGQAADRWYAPRYLWGAACDAWRYGWPAEEYAEEVDLKFVMTDPASEYTQTYTAGTPSEVHVVTLPSRD